MTSLELKALIWAAYDAKYSRWGHRRSLEWEEEFRKLQDLSPEKALDILISHRLVLPDHREIILRDMQFYLSIPNFEKLSEDTK